MADNRRHRGPHPADASLFAPAAWPTLQHTVHDLSWLLSRGYAAPSALKLTGDRRNLAARQRLAVMRSACGDEPLARRLRHRVSPEEVSGRTLMIDGFNLVTTMEAALAGGVLLLGREGCLRDMASMHGSYRRVSETRPALELIRLEVERLQPARCCWLLDRPVSNSGRLCEMIRQSGSDLAFAWEARLENDPDVVLRDLPAGQIAVTADSGILDQTAAWLNLAPAIVARHIPDAVPVPMAALCPPPAPRRPDA